MGLNNLPRNEFGDIEIIYATKAILTKLIEGKPLTAIYDMPEEWSRVVRKEKDRMVYQCARRPSLFKYVYPDGEIEYIDNDYISCIDIYADGTGDVFRHSQINKLMHEYFPIKMPYMPGEPIKVYCTDIHSTSGDYVLEVLYAMLPQVDGPDTRLDINRYFVEIDGIWRELTTAEYLKYSKDYDKSMTSTDIRMLIDDIKNWEVRVKENAHES
jgi:hypothetical protein